MLAFMSLSSRAYSESPKYNWATAVLAQQMRRPFVAGEDRVAVMVQDHPPIGDVQLPEGVLGMRPRLHRQRRIRVFADGPAIRHFTRVANDRNQKSLAIPIGIEQLGEVGVGHLKQANYTRLTTIWLS